VTQVALDPVEYAVPAAFSERVAETAVSAAWRAGAIQLNHFRNTAVRCRRLPHDVKLEIDCLCENVIIAAIRESFSDHAILTEESGLLPGSGEYTSIIDPLDGTVNFWHGLPFFCVSIACYRNGGPAGSRTPPAGLPGTPVTGVVFLPSSQELFVGTPGRGALLNGRPIRASHAESASDAIVTVNFGKTPDTMRRMTGRLDVLLPQVRKARCLGAVAAELAYIAAGFLDGLIYEGIRLWDFAAGKIILEAAGGFLEAAETEPGQWRVLAGAQTIRDSLESVLTL